MSPFFLISCPPLPLFVTHSVFFSSYHNIDAVAQTCIYALTWQNDTHRLMMINKITHTLPFRATFLPTPSQSFIPIISFFSFFWGGGFISPPPPLLPPLYYVSALLPPVYEDRKSPHYKCILVTCSLHTNYVRDGCWCFSENS